ncbi:MAG: choice-of-anchor D domain-containing protein [Myxococcota bacterium]
MSLDRPAIPSRAWLLLLVLPLGHCQCDADNLNQRTPASIAVDPTSVDFGDVPVSFLVERTVTVRNDGELELQITQVRVTGSNAFDVREVPTTVPGASSATLKVTFLPEEAAEETAGLVLVSNAKDHAETLVQLRGRGVDALTCGPCDTPPPPRCITVGESVEYEAQGFCENGECQYRVVRVPCPDYCDIETGRCVVLDGGVRDAGIPDAARPDAARPDAAVPDAAVPDAGGGCNVNGTYTVSGGGVAYTCCLGLVDVDIASFQFSAEGATIRGMPRSPTMSGAATTCPSGSFDVAYVETGGCTETYTLVGSFTGPDTWAGTYQVSFSGDQCDCFGGFGEVCENQAFEITASR